MFISLLPLVSTPRRTNGAHLEERFTHASQGCAQGVQQKTIANVGSNSTLLTGHECTAHFRVTTASRQSKATLLQVDPPGLLSLTETRVRLEQESKFNHHFFTAEPRWDRNLTKLAFRSFILNQKQYRVRRLRIPPSPSKQGRFLIAE